MARGSSWVRRGLLACLLLGATLIPGHAAGTTSLQCPGPHCGSHGTIRWTRGLSGAWTAESGVVGTVPADGQAYVSAGPQVAAIGYGLNVYAYSVRTGKPLWAVTLTGFPAGASIVSVRSWQRVVTAGVEFPDTGTPAGPNNANGDTARDEVVLAGPTGQRLRSYPASAYGGAVAADDRRAVIVGNTAVTSYDNGTGKPAWSKPTGPVPQAWRVDGGYLFVTVAAGGYLGAAPVTALRSINLATGAERVVRPPHGSFAGSLSGAVDGVVLFSGSTGLSAYSEATGKFLWRRAGAVSESEDLLHRTLYVGRGTGLVGLAPRTGAMIRGGAIPAASGLYGVYGGVALGIDQGALGDAWGYSVAQRRVVWTTSSLPWPHYFVDLSGIGGSADPASSTVLLAACAETGGTAAAGNGQVCLRPELVAINR
jgi:outer membrane protein assembly factor BamB